MNKHNEQLNSLWHQGDIELCPGTQNISPNVQSWWQDELLKGVFYSKKCNAAKVIHGFYDHLRWSETDLRVRENKTAVERNMSTGITIFLIGPGNKAVPLKTDCFSVIQHKSSISPPLNQGQSVSSLTCKMSFSKSQAQRKNILILWKINGSVVSVRKCLSLCCFQQHLLCAFLLFIGVSWEYIMWTPL